jgi:hypothetical protein
MNALIMEYLRGFISVTNDVTNVSHVANEVVNDLTNTLGTKYLTDLTPLLTPIIEDSELVKSMEEPLRSEYLYVARGVTDSLGLEKSPELSQYLLNKQIPILQKVVNGLLEVGRNIQSGNPNYAGLGDHALILLGATSVGLHFESTQAEGSDSRSFIHTFPQFIGVNIPPELLRTVTGFLSEKLAENLLFFTNRQEEASFRTNRLLELYAQDSGPGSASSSNERPPILNLVDKVTDIAFLSVKRQIGEMNSDSMAESITRVLNENGFDIPEVQVQELLKQLIHSEDPVIQPFLNGVKGYIQSVVEELFIRMATTNPGTDKTKMVMEMLIHRVSGQIVDQQNPQIRIDQKSEMTDRFYQDVVNDMMVMFEISGPDSLTMVPPFLRDVVFDAIRATTLVGLLNSKVPEIRHNTRPVFLTFLKNKLEELANPGITAAPQTVEIPEASRLQGWACDSLNHLANTLITALELPSNLNPGSAALGEMAVRGLGLVGPNGESVPGAIALANLAGQTLEGTTAEEWVSDTPVQRIRRIEAELIKWDAERTLLEGMTLTGSKPEELNFVNHKIEETRSLLHAAIDDRMRFELEETSKIQETKERIEQLIPQVAIKAVKDNVKSSWHSSQERMDNSIRRRFGLGGEKVKNAFDFAGRRALINPLKGVFRGLGNVATVASRGYVRRRVDILDEFLTGEK